MRENTLKDKRIVYGIEEIGGQGQWYVGETLRRKFSQRIGTRKRADDGRRHLYGWIKDRYFEELEFNEFAKIHVLEEFEGTKKDAPQREEYWANRNNLYTPTVSISKRVICIYKSTPS